MYPSDTVGFWKSTCLEPKKIISAKVLTVMGNRDRCSWCEDSVGAELCGSLRGVLDLDTGESRLASFDVSDGELVRWALGEQTAGVIQDFDGLGTGVGNGGDKLEVLHTSGSAWSCSRISALQLRICSFRKYLKASRTKMDLRRQRQPRGRELLRGCGVQRTWLCRR